jgi:hypothetical protein
MIKTLTFLLLITIASAIPIFFPAISRPHIAKQQNTKESAVPTEQKETDYCSICDFLISKSEEYITKRTTREDALHIMKTNCNHLPKMRFNDCVQIVADKGEKMIQMITKKEDTSIICSNLHVCDKVGLNISDCFFCNYASKRINFFVNENHTISDIIDYGDTFCDHIGPSYRNTCSRFMDAHYLNLIAKLIDRHTPNDACEAIRMCLK